MNNFPCYDDAIVHLTLHDEKMAWLIDRMGKLTFYDERDDFLSLVENIIGQMLSVKAMHTIVSRLTDKCGGDINAQTILALGETTLKQIGISKRKASCIYALANAVYDNELHFDELKHLSDSDITKTLTSFYGIGAWTAKMYLYKIHRPNILPFEDIMIQRAFSYLYGQKFSSSAIRSQAEYWSPYMSIASMYLYEFYKREIKT